MKDGKEWRSKNNRMRMRENEEEEEEGGRKEAYDCSRPRRVSTI